MQDAAMIRYKNLSWWLKIAAIAGWIYAVVIAIEFIYGFVTAL